MTLPVETQERLAFLVRVVGKEITHLEYAANQAFTPPLTLSAVDDLDSNPALALRLEAFTSRFCRLQDTLGDKLLPALLKALGESPSALLINLNKAEKYGWLESVDEWVSLRQLRNKMIHEYIEDANVLHASLVTAYENVSVLEQFSGQLITQVERLQEGEVDG
ncbi:hypothetical protein [Halomonas sp.]|uniref:hypothetical protein n=1 Tax=Halomonas sp. TaxID=1486246 RepID=UPI00260B1770|nr:hypothetical protein [Halomonas sp.]